VRRLGHSRTTWIAVVLAALLAGCAEQTFRQTQNFDRPHDIALSCWRRTTQELRPVPLVACSARIHGLYGFVTNTSFGDVAVLDVLNRANVDVPFAGTTYPAQALPGFTRAKVGELPAVIVADPTSRFVYTINRGSRDVSRIETQPGGSYTVVTQRLPYRPYDAIVGPWPGVTFEPFLDEEPVPPGTQATPEYQKSFDDWERAAIERYASVPWALYVSAPADGVVLVVPLEADGFGTLAAADLTAIEFAAGAPQQLAMTDDGDTLFATHLDRGWVSAIDLATAAEERIWLTPACANGVDDDGDGAVDGADGGCEDADDEDEREPETGAACDNGADDDGDGATDAADAGCAAEPALFRCADGVDDDGDGATDLDDPGCASPHDDSEASDQATCRSPVAPGDDALLASCQPAPDALRPPAEELAAALRCGNGGDDDGDGLTDETDEDECPGLLARATECWDALDQDGDGAADTADEGCLTPFTALERPPACANGVDDDGDGATDWPEDPGCYGRDAATEVDRPAPELGPIAVSPARPGSDGDGDDIGAFVYVGDQTNWSVHVVAWPEGAEVDVLGRSADAGGNPLWRRLGLRGIQLGAAPRGIAFVTHPNQGVTAFVSAASGSTSVIEVVHPAVRCAGDAAENPADFPARALHRLAADGQAVESSAGQPELLRGTEPLDLAFSVIPEFPSLGSFSIETDPRPAEAQCADGADDDGDGFVDCADPDCGTKAPCACADGTAHANPYAPALPDETRTYYGVRFRDDVRLQLGETWTVRYEGVLPGTARTTGRLLDAAGTFHDPDVDWCALGVEPGDLLVVKAREGCWQCGDFVGERFEWRIAELRADTLLLEGPGRSLGARSRDPNAPTVCLRAAGVTPEGDPDADFTLPPVVTLADDVPLPTPACFAGALDYEIRAPERYLVTGSVTGYLHDWRNDGGRCVRRTDSDERFRGRAEETPANGGQGGCTYDEAGTEFTNLALRLRVYQGCSRGLDGRAEPVETERDIAWRFSVTSGFGARRLVTGQIPGRSAALSGSTLRRVYVVDSSGEAVFELNAELDAESVRDTFF